MSPAGTPQDPIRPEDEIGHFLSIPWCAAHLSAPGLTVAPVFSRSIKPRHEDALFAQTLKTRDTIRAFVCFYPQPRPGPTPEADKGLLLSELKALASLGSLVSGYGGIAHGGIVACLFDDVLGLIHPGSRWRTGSEEPAAAGGASVVTAYLKTTYLRPVTTPGDYLITVWLKKAEGRKVFVEGVMENEKGEKLARAEALFIEARGKL